MDSLKILDWLSLKHFISWCFASTEATYGLLGTVGWCFWARLSATSGLILEMAQFKETGPGNAFRKAKKSRKTKV